MQQPGHSLRAASTAPRWAAARGVTGKLRGWLLVSQAGNSPLRSQSSGWISETAVVGISGPAHSGQAAGHRAGKPAKSKEYQVRKKTPFFWQFQSPIAANKVTHIQAVRLIVSVLKQNPKPKWCGPLLGPSSTGKE